MELAVTLFLLVAVICFAAAVIHDSRSQISPTNLGLFFFALAFLVPHFGTLSHLMR